MCEKETGGFDAGAGGNGNSARDQAEGGKVYTTEFRPASAERVDQLAKKVAQLEQAVYGPANAWAHNFLGRASSNNAASGPSNYDTPKEDAVMGFGRAVRDTIESDMRRASPLRPYLNSHEHEWFVRDGNAMGGGGGPSVVTKEWACYCGATKKEVVTEPKRANL